MTTRISTIYCTCRSKYLKMKELILHVSCKTSCHNRTEQLLLLAKGSIEKCLFINSYLYMYMFVNNSLNVFLGNFLSKLKRNENKRHFNLRSLYCSIPLQYLINSIYIYMYMYMLCTLYTHNHHHLTPPHSLVCA